MATPTQPSPPHSLGGSTKDIFTERTFVASDFISGVGYGVQLVLYAWCSMYLIQQRKDRKYSMYLWAYITLLLIVETMICVFWSQMVEAMFVDNRNYPGGPLGWFVDNQRLPTHVSYFTCLFLLTFLSDLLVLWRCWVIWTASGRRQAYLVILLPAIMILASFIMGILATLQLIRSGLSSDYSEVTTYGIARHSISIGVNIILTSLIVLRLWSYRQNLISSLPKEFAKHYVSLGAIIVESAALYCLFAILHLITYAIESPVHQVFLTLVSFAQPISAYLIIYRVADGSAFGSKTLTIHATTIKFAGPPQSTRGSGSDSQTVHSLTPSSLYNV